MKVRLEADEWYPVFTIVNDRHTWVREVEMEEELIERLNNVIAEFEQVQGEVQKVYREARKCQK